MEILFLISFVIFFLFGFYAGKKNKKIKSALENCSHSYAQGLNYLLANESDKAIQLFVDLIKVDGETAETHLALGKLFRSKGEVDKAIKIHLNILAKPSLELNQRVQVLFELASDYHKAGLLDRAENVFKELLELDEHNIVALQHLLSMYIAEKSWIDAIAYAEVLIELKVKDSLQTLTHCYCELAESKVEKNEFHLARQYLQLAIDAQSNCVRAFIIRFKIEIIEDKVKDAKKTLNILMKDHLSIVDLYIDKIYLFYKRRNALEKYPLFLKKFNLDSSNKTINLSLLNFYFENSNFHAGYELLDTIINSQGDLGVYEIALKHLTLEQFGCIKYANLYQYLHHYNQHKLHYNCLQCGYALHSMQWQCPSCNAWSSIKLKG